jgi:hypothetical protein
VQRILLTAFPLLRDSEAEPRPRRHISADVKAVADAANLQAARIILGDPRYSGLMREWAQMIVDRCGESAQQRHLLEAA